MTPDMRATGPGVDIVVAWTSLESPQPPLEYGVFCGSDQHPVVVEVRAVYRVVLAAQAALALGPLADVRSGDQVLLRVSCHILEAIQKADQKVMRYPTKPYGAYRL